MPDKIVKGELPSVPTIHEIKPVMKSKYLGGPVSPLYPQLSANNLSYIPAESPPNYYIKTEGASAMSPMSPQFNASIDSYKDLPVTAVSESLKKLLKESISTCANELAKTMFKDKKDSVESEEESKVDFTQSETEETVVAFTETRTGKKTKSKTILAPNFPKQIPQMLPMRKFPNRNDGLIEVYR